MLQTFKIGLLMSVGMLLLIAASPVQAGIIFSDDFDAGLGPDVGPAWGTISNGSILGAPAPEFFSGNALYFTSVGPNTPRFATTGDLDVSLGGNVDFRFKIGGDPDTPTFEDADHHNPGDFTGLFPEGVPEDVVLEYSTNGGGSWTLINTYDTEDPAFSANWGAVSEPIPVGAQTASTRFRWRQVIHSGETIPTWADPGPFDQWAIDDVSINAVMPAVVPEPSSIAVFGMGALGMLYRRVRRRKQLADVLEDEQTDS